MHVINIFSNKLLQQLICYCYELLLVVTIVYGFTPGYEYQTPGVSLSIGLTIFQLAMFVVLVIYLKGAKSKAKSLNLMLQNNHSYNSYSKREVKVLRGKLSLGSKIYIIIFILVSLLYYFYQKNWDTHDLIRHLCIVVIYFIIHASLEIWRTGNLIEYKLSKKNKKNGGQTTFN